MSTWAEFEREIEIFTARMKVVADWKQSYFGASYATRLSHAIDEARDAAKEMERAIKEHYADRTKPLAAVSGGLGAEK